nr:preprotein translocase SecG subunit [Cavernulicola chilensis]
MVYNLLQSILILSMICLIIAIMIYNPKHIGFEFMSSQVQPFSNTRSSAQIINKIIWTLTSIIFIGTIILYYYEH